MLLLQRSRALSSLVSSRLSPRHTERVSLPVGLLVTCALRVYVRVRVAHGGEKGRGPLCTLYLLARQVLVVSPASSRVCARDQQWRESSYRRNPIACVFSRCRYALGALNGSVWHVSGANRRSANRALRFAPISRQSASGLERS